VARTPAASDEAIAITRPRLLTPTFLLVCTVGFLGYAHMLLLGPILPLYIQAHGGTAIFVGVVVASFSATSFVLRPFLGRAVDGWTARGVLGISTLILGLSSATYLMYQVVILLAVRAVHGIGWAGFNTSTNVLLSRVTPQARRGEGVGYYMVAQGSAVAFLPACALWLLGYVGYAGVFCISAAGGLLAAAAALALPAQPRVHPQPASGGFGRGLVERSALLPSTLHFLTQLAQPATAGFLPLYALSRGIPVELLLYYYLAAGVASVSARGLFGAWSDRVGRGRAVAVGTVVAAAGLLTLSQAADILTLTIGGVLTGFGTSATTAPLITLAMDRSPPERRGAAMASYSMAFQLADGGGSLLCGVLIETVGYSAMYLAVALAPVVSLLIVARSWRAMAQRGETPA
jgi:MFS family permease